MSVRMLARSIVQKLTPYLSARRIGGSGDVWINANESPFDNAYVVEAMNLNRYSECQPKELIKAYADYAGLNTNQVLVSRGADEGIELLIRTFCENKKDNILYCPPTYGMYEVSAQAFEVNTKIVPLFENWQLNLTEIENQLRNVKLVFICNPNNPTSNLIDFADIEALLELTKGKAIAVIDEAYIEFSPQASSLHLLEKYAHLAILRTLSKAFSLAGLRCGFTLASPEIIELMLKVIAPYPIPRPVTSIACQALTKQGIARMLNQVELLNENKDYFSKELDKLSKVTVFPSSANFVLAKFPNANPVFDALWQQGIIARRTQIENCIRFSIGTKEECQKTFKAICKQLEG